MNRIVFFTTIVGSCIEQRQHTLLAVLPDCVHQSCPAVTVAGVQLGAVLYVEGHGAGARDACRKYQSRAPRIVCLIDICACFEQHLFDFSVSC